MNKKIMMGSITCAIGSRAEYVRLMLSGRSTERIARIMATNTGAKAKITGMVV